MVDVVAVAVTEGEDGERFSSGPPAQPLGHLFEGDQVEPHRAHEPQRMVEEGGRDFEQAVRRERPGRQGLT
jgi:hypothetical protein